MLALLWFGAVPPVRANTVAKEYQVKAAFIFNFLRFVEWPAERFESPEAPYVIGIVGPDPFGRAMDALTTKLVKGRPIQVRRFADLTGSDPSTRSAEWKQLGICHVLFFYSSEVEHVAEILAALQDMGTLTIGEKPNFLEVGGMINFVTEDSKARFEVNLVAVRRTHIQIRAQLLRLAKRVIDK